MSIPIKQMFISIFFATLFFSCGKEDLSVLPDEASVISFSPRVDDVITTREKSTSTGTLNNFGVYASVDAMTPFLLMENELIYKDQYNKWRYDYIKYWPENETVSFFAYTPYGNSNISYTYGSKSIACIIPDNPENQFDLMAAKASNMRSIDGPVALLFKHLLSRIDFVVSAADNQENLNIILNKFQLVVGENAIYNSGQYDHVTDIWNINNSSYLNGGNYELISTATSLPEDGWDYALMLLPQEHQTGYITVNIDYSVSNNNNATLHTKQVSIPLSRIVCEKGKKYTYNFRISPSDMTLEIGVLPWNTGGWETEINPDNP